MKFAIKSFDKYSLVRAEIPKISRYIFFISLKSNLLKGFLFFLSFILFNLYQNDFNWQESEPEIILASFVATFSLSVIYLIKIFFIRLTKGFLSKSQQHLRALKLINILESSYEYAALIKEGEVKPFCNENDIDWTVAEKLISQYKEAKIT